MILCIKLFEKVLFRKGVALERLMLLYFESIVDTLQENSAILAAKQGVL